MIWYNKHFNQAEFFFEIAEIYIVLHILSVINFVRLIKIQSSINTVYLQVRIKPKFIYFLVTTISFLEIRT